MADNGLTQFGVGDPHPVTFRIVQNSWGEQYTVVDDPHEPDMRCWTCEKHTVFPVRKCPHIQAVLDHLKGTGVSHG